MAFRILREKYSCTIRAKMQQEDFIIASVLQGENYIKFRQVKKNNDETGLCLQNLNNYVCWVFKYMKSY